MKTGLFAWFCQTLSSVFAKDLGSTPLEVLSRLNAPEKLLNWVKQVEDEEFAFKLVNGCQVPDLESRHKTRKRLKGQYYTPEDFALLLLNKLKPAKPDKILDPACGDGSFLLAAAKFKSMSSNTQKPLECVCGVDVDAQALLVCLARLISEFPGQGWPCLRHDDFLTCEFSEKFSLIIGNPPYRVNLDQNFVSTLKKRYKTAEGEKDLYTFFLERSAELLETKGELILLTSHTYLVNHHCKMIREYIFSWQVKNLMLLPARFFVKAPGVLPVVTHLCKQKEAENFVTIFSGYENGNWKRQVKTECESMKDAKGLRQAFLSPLLKEIFANIEQKHPLLGDLCRVGVGIQESLKREGTISRFVSETKIDQNYRPVLKGREISPFKINWEGRYLKYGSHLAYAGDENVFKSPKILYQNIRNEKLKTRLVAALDLKGFYPKNSISFIVPKSENLLYEYVLAVINSTLINAWFSGHYHSFHITVSQVKTIPLAIAEMELQKKIRQAVLKLEDCRPGSDKETDMKTLIDKMVCQAYMDKHPFDRLLTECDIFLEQAAGL